MGDWLRNKEGRVGVVTAVDDDGKATVKVPSLGKNEVVNEGWQVIVKASEVDSSDSVDLLKKEIRILNSPEALKKFATPTPEGQAARHNKICLCSVEDLTQAGHKMVMDRFHAAVAGKSVAKVIGIEKLGQMDLMLIKLGDNDEFPFTVMVEIERDGEGKPRLLRILNSTLPVEFLDDFAKFLRDLAKEGKADASKKK